MMRRSRVSIKPNFKPGSRTGTEGEQATQTATRVDNTLKAKELEKATQSNQQSATLKEPAEDVGLEKTPVLPTKTNQNNGAPSSGAEPSSTVSHRRMRISAAPKLVRPKLISTPRPQMSANVHDMHVPDSVSEVQTSVSVNPNSLSNSRTPRKLTSTTEPSSTMSQPTNLCVPSTSGLQKALVSGKNVLEDSPPSPQPGEVPHQPSQKPELLECPFTQSLTNSKLYDKADSPEMSEIVSDKERILRALKLKELMKIERRRDIQKGKKRVRHKDYTAVDHTKMTMRDLIYYLPDTSPMRSSVECAENPEETIIPPSPKKQIKTAEKDEGEEEEEEESDNEGMLMPRVRVAEDGSLILDEESLTVRVQRTSNTKLVENSTLFERGSTTTYSSFRTQNYVKSWSVRETDLFFLAISMVGTDFSLIGQLLPHRNRSAIKSKFKKEEKVNPWRVDKAMKNSRPFDKEFFSYLLEKVLAKDQDKRKSIKLVLPKTRKPSSSKGKKCNKTLSDDVKENYDNSIFHMVDEDLEDDGVVKVDKESEALSNEKENAPKKRCKRTRDISNSNDECSEEQVKRKRQRRKTKEVLSKEVGEGEGELNDESDSSNVNKGDKLEENTPALERGHKQSKDKKKNRIEKPVQKRKSKQIKKSLEEESVSQHKESCIVDDEGSSMKKKRKQAKNKDLDNEEPVVEKKKTKRKRALKSTVVEEVMAEKEDSSADLQEAEVLNTAEVKNYASPKQSKKPLPKLAKTQNKKGKVPEISAEIDEKSQDEENHESVLTAADSSLEDGRLQMQAVVVLEKTPPRQQYFLSPSKMRCKNYELKPSISSPSSDESSTLQSRMQIAGRVKQPTSKIAKRRKESIDQYGPVTVSPIDLLESITRKDEDEDNSLNENLIDLSCLHGLDSHVFQKRPMVVLSREEVDMILKNSEQSSEEDPSVSPLDLSLNTELSFPFQCSKLLEDNDGADVVDYVEENEKTTNVGAYCDPTNVKELELTESALAQPDLSSLWNNSTLLKLEACSQPEMDLSNVTNLCLTRDVEPQVHPVAQEDVTVAAEVLDVSPPIDFFKNFEPICIKRDATVTQETNTSKATTLSISTVVPHLLEESNKSVLPSLPNEKSKLDSSKVTSRLESQIPLQADKKVKAELQKSLEVPSQSLEMQDLSESKEDTQEPGIKSPEIKAQTQRCAVGLEFTEESQKEMSAQSRRSRILKLKPNLNQKSRDQVSQIQGQHLERVSTLKPQSIEPNLSDASTTVSVQENMSTPTQGPGSPAKPLEASDRCSITCDVNMIPPCPSPQFLQNLEDAGSGQTIVSSEDVCSPAEIVHLTNDGPNDAEPTFILTLYEIPVNEAHLPSSSNDAVMISDLPVVETNASLGYLDPALSLPSTYSIDSLQLQSNSCIVAQNSLEGEKKNLAKSSHDTTSPHTRHKDCDPSASFKRGILTFHPHSVPLDLASSSHDAPGFSISKCISQEHYLKTEQRERVSHLQLDDVFVPVLEEIEDSLSSDKATNVQCKLECFRDSTVSATRDLKKKCDKDQRCNYSRSHESILLYPNDEVDDACENPETGFPHLECKIPSEFSPPKDLSSRMNQSTSIGFTYSKCITLHQESGEKDTEQCGRVSHVLLDDPFVPVSEELHDNSSNIDVQLKLQSNEASTVSDTKDLAEIVKQQISEDSASYQPILSETKHEEGDAYVHIESYMLLNSDAKSECKNCSEVLPSESLPSCDQSSSSGFNYSKCNTLHQDCNNCDTEKCVIASHMMLGNIVVTDSKDLKDDLSKNIKMAVYCKLESNETSTVNVTADLSENVNERISEKSTSEKTVLLDTKGAGNVTCKNVSSKTLSTPPVLNTSKCILLHQDPEDPEQCDRVSHVLLGDVFVPVIEELVDNLSKSGVVKCKENSLSLPEGQEAPFNEIIKVENSPSLSSTLLCFDSLKESEKTKASPRRRQQVKPRPKLVKRACVKVDVSTPEVVKDPLTNQPTSSYPNLPASCEENLSRVSNTNIKKSVKKMPFIEGNYTFAGKVKEEKLHFTAGESLEMSQSQLETKPIATNLYFSKGTKVDQGESKNAMGETMDKAHLESSAEDKQLSVLTPSESANVHTCCEAMHFNPLRSPGSGSSTIDSRIEARGVSHMVLPDVFVLVSDVMKDDDWTESIKSSLQRASLLERAGTHFETELITEDVTQQCVEDLTVKTKTPDRKRTKANPSQQSLHTSSSLSSTQLPQRNNMLQLEEKLQKKHYIVPCSVKLSSLDTVDQNLYASQLGDRRNNDKTTVISSPLRHAHVMTPSLSGEGPKFENKSPTRRKDQKHGHLNPVETSSHTRQLTITDWVKTRSCQTEANQQEKSAKSPQKQSHPKAKDVHQLMDEKTGSKCQHGHSKEPECSQLVPSFEENKEVNSASKELQEVKRLSEMVAELTKDKSVAWIKSPPKRRAKLQVKPTLAKRMYTKGNTSTSDQQPATWFNSPTQHGVQTAREKVETENETKQSVKNASDAFRDEAHFKCKGSPQKRGGQPSPKSQDVWPKVVLPRVKLDTTEAGICSGSSTPTSSPARVMHSAVTPPQMKKSPTPIRSPAANENLDDDPAKVSQFFLSDIFTEVEQAE